MKIYNLFFITIISHAAIIAKADDYFNPQFLGNDVASINSLQYLTNGNDIIPGTYQFFLYVGDENLGNKMITFFEDEKTQKVSPCFSKEIIELLPLKSNIKNEIISDKNNKKQCIDIGKKIQNFNYEIDVSNLKLILSIPQLYLNKDKTSLAPRKYWDNGITAFITNYSFSGSNFNDKETDNKSESYYFTLGNKLNVGPWRLLTDMYWNYSKYGSEKNSEFHINNVSLSRALAKINSTLIIGQSGLGSSLFDTLLFRGVNIRTENSMLSENERGYAPNIKGIVTSKTKITIRQNGNIIYQDYLEPGPYNIDDLYPSGSNGDYDVELIATDGKVTKYIVPYATLPDMQKEGRFNYNIALGETENNGNVKFIQTSLNYGLPFSTTVNSGVQVSSNYQALALGISKDIGQFGALSFDVTNSMAKINDKKYEGQSYRFLYSKALQDLGTSLRLVGYRYSTSGFYTFDEANSLNNIKNNYYTPTEFMSQYHKKSSFQANLTQSLGDYGQIYAWGVLNSYWKGKDSQNIQIGWSKTLTKAHNLTINANLSNYKYSNGNRENIFFLNFSLPLKDILSGSNSSMYLSNAMSYNEKSKYYNNTTSIYGSAYDQKLGYNIYQSLSKVSSQNSTGLNVNYNGNNATLNAGTNYSNNSSQINYGIKGSAIIHDGGVTLANQISDNAILIQAKGASGAKISRSSMNLHVDSSGFALIPYATPYVYNDVEIDPSSFGDNYNIEDKILKTVPTQGAITKVIFDVQTGYNFLSKLTYEGKPIRFGSVVKNKKNGNMFIVNDDGSVYLTGVNDGSEFVVQWDNNASCKFVINIPENFKPEVVNKINNICK